MAIIYNTSSTLNGFIADKENSLQWLFDVPGSDSASEDFGSFLSTVGTIAMGSTTYEWLLKDWISSAIPRSGPMCMAIAPHGCLAVETWKPQKENPSK